MKYDNSLNISIKLDIEDLKKGGKEAQNAIENISKKLPLIKSNIEMGIDKKKYITELHNLEYTIKNYNKNLKITTKADFETEGIQKFNSVLNQTKIILNETNRGLGGFLQKSGDMVKFIAYDIGKNIIPALSSLLKVSINIEKVKTSYISLFQSIEEGEQSFAEIRKYANITPFSTEDLVKTAGILKSVNIETKELTKIIDRLGNLAKGDAEVMNSLAIAYSRMKAKEKVQLEELNIFTERGIPIVQELAKSYNTTASQIYEMVSMGKIGFTELEKAINSLTDKGGMFSKGIETGANTLSGKLSTLKDAFADMLDSLGSKTLPYLKNFIDSLTNGINILSRILKGIPSIITVAVLSLSVLAATIQAVHLATGGLIPSLGAMINSLKLLASQAIILNGAMTGLTIGGLAGLVSLFGGLAYAVSQVIKYNNELTKSYKSIQDNEKQLEDAIKKRQQAEKNAEKGGNFRKAYIEALENETLVINELRKAYDELSDAEKKKTLENLSRAIKQDSQTIEEYSRNIQNLSGKERAEAEQQLKAFKEKLEISKKLYDIYTKPIEKLTGQAGTSAQIELKSQSFEGLRLSEKIKLQMEIDPKIDKQALLRDIQAKIDEIEKSGELQAKLQILSENKTISQNTGESDADFEKRINAYNELRKKAQEYISEYIALKNLKESILKSDEEKNKKEIEYIDNLETAKIKLEEGIITQAQYIEMLKQRNEASKQELNQLLSKENLTKEEFEKLKEILDVKRELLEFQKRENQEKEKAKQKLQEELEIISQIASKVANIGKKLGLSEEMSKLVDITANMVSNVTKVIANPTDIISWIGIIENAIDGIITTLDTFQSNSQSKIKNNLQNIESITNNISSEIEYWNTQFSITDRNLNSMEKSLSKLDEKIKSINEAMKQTNDLITKANEREELSNLYDIKSIKGNIEKLKKDKEEIEKLNSYSNTRKIEIDTNILSINSEKSNLQNYIASLDKAIKEKETAYNSILSRLKMSYSNLTKDNISSYITSIANEKYSYNTLLSSIQTVQNSRLDRLLWYELQTDKRQQLKNDIQKLKTQNLIGEYDYFILSELSAGKWMWKPYVDNAFKNIQENIKSKIGVLDSNISQLNSLTDVQNSINNLLEQKSTYTNKLNELNQKITELNNEKTLLNNTIISTNEIDKNIAKYQDMLDTIEKFEENVKKRDILQEKRNYIIDENQRQQIQAQINSMIEEEIKLLDNILSSTSDVIKKSELELEILKRKKQLEGDITAELEKQRNLKLSELEKQLKIGMLDAENWIDQNKIKRVLADLNFSFWDQAAKLQEYGAVNNIASKTINIGNIQTVIHQANPDDYQDLLLTIIRRAVGQI